MEDKPVYKGYLLLPPQGKIVLKKSWTQKYCLLYRQSKFGIDRLEIYDSLLEVSKHSKCRIITLENIILITPKFPNLIVVTTKNTQYEFLTQSEECLNEWITAIQSVAFKDNISKITSIEEDNDLYISSGEGVFQVTLCPSEATKRCKLEPNKIYTLLMTSTAIQLRSLDGQVLFTWPYCYIRRYGYRSGKFTFEAGRKCESGEGVFHLEHSNQQEIFRCVSSKMKSMKKLLSGESTTSLLDCGDNQFHAALNMEARSRSPLPPSPTSSTKIHELELQNSMHSLVSFTESLFLDKGNLNQNIEVRRPLPKPKPVKPPRKNLPILTKNISDSSLIMNPDVDDVNRYDEVEFKTEAWRTQGVSEVRHTESMDNLEEYFSWGNRKESIPDLPTTKPSSKVFTNPTPTAENYDHLQFFGSTSKLNIPGYKQVQPLSLTLPSTQNLSSWSDYDEVVVNNMQQSVRSADDSHLGYGMIRKTSNKNEKTNTNSLICEKNNKIEHEIVNDNVYAVVSKPKHV